MHIFALLLFCLGYGIYMDQPAKASQASCKVFQAPVQAKDLLIESVDSVKTSPNLNTGLPGKSKISTMLIQDGELYLGTDDGKLFTSSHPEKGIWDQEDVSISFPKVGEFYQTQKGINGIFPGHKGVYATIWESGFYRKVKGKSTWEPMHTALPELNIHNLVETQDGTIFVSSPSGIYRTKDDGKTWKHIFAEGWVSNLSEIGGIIVGNGEMGLLRSHDDGEHWNWVIKDEGAGYKTNVVDGRFVAIRVAGSRRSAPEENPYRTFTSYDSGNTWVLMNDRWSQDRNIYDIVKVGQYLFSSRKEGIYRSSDGGENWDLVRALPATKDPLRFELSVSGETLFAAIVFNGC